MCGIFALLFVNSEDKNDASSINIQCNNALTQLNNRGPDQSNSIYVYPNKIHTLFFGFTRLAINDLTDNGMQPMQIYNSVDSKRLYLTCNGEIYNYQQIIEDYAFHTTSMSDCEVILHLYDHFVNVKKLSISDAMMEISNELDGEFAFVIYDESSKCLSAMRDHMGVRPMFMGKTRNDGGICFGSELKALYDICDDIKQVPGGTFLTINTGENEFKVSQLTNFVCLNNIPQMDNTITEDTILSSINSLMRDAVKKRVFTSEREICCLLSGGLDSSLVSALVASHLPPYTLKTFSIGIKGSPDLMYAEAVAKFIKSEHHSIELTEEDFLDAIENTIMIIESYDTTSVRASVGNYLVSKYIREKTNCKVVFNGDYSDEVCGGYKYMWNAPTDKLFDEECKSLIDNIIYFDSLRSDRTIASQGLEARVPFSDKAFVKYYLSIPSHLRKPYKERPEKYLLRKAFDKDNILPTDVLWRPKEAFSDGVSKQTRSWHVIVSEHIDKLVSDEEFIENKDTYVLNPPMMKETYYYRMIFEKKYGSKCASIIPKYWLPKWCGDLHDPSAREISKC